MVYFDDKPEAFVEAATHFGAYCEEMRSKGLRLVRIKVYDPGTQTSEVPNITASRGAISGHFRRTK